MKKKLTGLLALLAALMLLFSACAEPSGSIPEAPGSYDTVTQVTEAALPPETDPGSDAEAILDLAYSLAPGEALEEEVILTGTVLRVDTPYSEKYNNTTVTMALPGQEDRPIQCFRLTGSGCDFLVPGDRITVRGFLQNYKGTVEFAEGCYLEEVFWGDVIQSISDDSKDAVAAYIYENGWLPDFYMTKNEAEEVYGWEGGPLDAIAPGMAIGGDRFGNYGKNLPSASGRTYYECDIDTIGAGSRGAKRIVFSNDGLVYYTDDHYETFELLYGEP